MLQGQRSPAPPPLRCPAPALPARGPHRGVGTGPWAAPRPAHSRTTLPRRCWSCRRDRALLETQVPRGGRALGQAQGALLGELGETRSLTGTFHPCCHPLGSPASFPSLGLFPIPAPIPGVSPSLLPSPGAVPIPAPVLGTTQPAGSTHLCQGSRCSHGWWVLLAHGCRRRGAVGRPRRAGGTCCHCNRARWRRMRRRRRWRSCSPCRGMESPTWPALRGTGLPSAPGLQGGRSPTHGQDGQTASAAGQRDGHPLYRTLRRERLHPIPARHQREQLLPGLPAQRVCREGREGASVGAPPEHPEAGRRGSRGQVGYSL